MAYTGLFPLARGAACCECEGPEREQWTLWSVRLRGGAGRAEMPNKIQDACLALYLNEGIELFKETI